jgi:hypothetical protein
MKVEETIEKTKSEGPWSMTTTKVSLVVEYQEYELPYFGLRSLLDKVKDMLEHPEKYTCQTCGAIPVGKLDHGICDECGMAEAYRKEHPEDFEEDYHEPPDKPDRNWVDRERI